MTASSKGARRFAPSAMLHCRTCRLRARAEINSHFAAGPQARWRGASDELYPVWYVRSEQQNQRACGPQPEGARRRAGICFVAAPRRCPTSPASRRLASARPALAPKCEFISARALRGPLLALSLMLSLASCWATQSETEAKIESLLEAAQRAQSAGDLQATVENYRQVLALKPNFPEVQTNLGLLLYLRGEYQECVTLLQNALKMKPDSLPAELFLGMAFLKLYKYSQAIDPLRRVLRQDPSHVEARLTLCSAYVATKRLETAVRECNSAARISPQNPETWYALGESALRAAKHLVDEWGSKSPQSPYFYLLKGAAYRERENYAQAVIEYQKALKNPEGVLAQVHLELGEGYLLQADPEKAISHFNQIPGDSEPVRYAWGMSQAALSRRDFVAFEHWLKQIEKVNASFVSAPPWFVALSLPVPDCAALQRELEGDAARHLSRASLTFLEILIRRATENASGFGHTSESQANGHSRAGVADDLKPSPDRLARAFMFGDCARALESLPGTLRLQSRRLVQLAECRWAMGDFEKSLQASSQSLTRNPRDDEALYWKIKSLLQLSKYSFYQLSQIPTGKSRLHELMGKAYEARNQDDRAIEEYKQAIAVSPGSVETHNSLGDLYMRNARYEAAIESFTQAIQYSPNDPDARYGLGVALVQLRQAEPAVEHLQKALSVIPDWPAAQLSLGQAFRQLGRVREAIAQFEKAAGSDVDGSIHYQLFQLHKRVKEEDKANEALKRSMELRKEADKHRVDLIRPP